MLVLLSEPITLLSLAQANAQMEVGDITINAFSNAQQIIMVIKVTEIAMILPTSQIPPYLQTSLHRLGLANVHIIL